MRADYERALSQAEAAKAPLAETLKKAAWKAQHEQFQNALKSAAAITAGAPPPADLHEVEDTRTPCPHCGQTFGSATLPIHVERCASRAALHAELGSFSKRVQPARRPDPLPEWEQCANCGERFAPVALPLHNARCRRLHPNGVNGFGPGADAVTVAVGEGSHGAGAGAIRDNTDNSGDSHEQTYSYQGQAGDNRDNSRRNSPERSCSCLLYTSPSPPDRTRSRMPSSA